MRNVSRVAAPAVLKKNAAAWREALLRERRRRKPNKARLARLTERYNCAQVRDALTHMYSGLCCYCEGLVGIVAFEHIEHRMPKATFPQHTFKWGNLHLACQKCNVAKGKKWTERAPILDACGKERIEEHLTYEFKELLRVPRVPRTSRGTTTVSHTDLNREELLDARLKIALAVLQLIVKLNEAPDSPEHSVLRLELRAKEQGQFGSLVGWIVSSFLRTA